MAPTLVSRLSNAWNAFISFNEKKDQTGYFNIGPGYSRRPDLSRYSVGSERSIVNSVYTKIAIDVSSVPIQHVKLDKDGLFASIIDSGLNNCLSLDTNIDQTARAFMQDVARSLCVDGVVAIVPVDTTVELNETGAYDILSLRVGRIVEWFPGHVRVDLYNDKTGYRQEIVLSKLKVAIVENPLYSVMNEPNSTLQRLIRKLNILDAIDQQSGNGKLDLIIQLPYAIKSEGKQRQAEHRKMDIESQLHDSKYGIAYTDATEKITQLNRPAENNLMNQIEYLTSMLYGQLGLDKSIFDGTANKDTMQNYQLRTIDPFIGVIIDSMRRRFLTKTARTQGQTILPLRKTLNSIPASELGPLINTLSKNKMVTVKEVRSVFNYKADMDLESPPSPSLPENNPTPSPLDNQGMDTNSN